jgi:sugar lactone lactonase YvrE
MDGRIWQITLGTNAAQPFADPPLMPAGMHEAPDDPDHVYFCASRLGGAVYDADEAVGLYRFDVAERTSEAVVLRVPDTQIDHDNPVVYADADPSAPELGPDGATPSRPLAFCNDLEISEDGRRIYFSEPFAYEGAAMGGSAIAEAVALARNGRLWRHDLDTGTTRLVAEGFNFIDGVLYDLHPGHARERSVLVSQTPHFRLTRFYLAGDKAGRAETVLDGITGMPDGMDRDRDGRIWIGLLKERSKLLTWVHANAWIKPLMLRLPLDRAPQTRRTGVLALSPDAGTPLYSASYDGPLLSNIASAVPGPDGVYLTPFDPDHKGIVRLPYPALGP